jgi:lysophospholipase L1-like esterase
LAAPGKIKTSKRTWLFRTGAIVLGLAIPVGLELVCRLFGWGSQVPAEDPFVGFKSVNPLFELNQDSGSYEIPKAKLKFFSPESFPAQKPSGTYRIFCLGGSTMKGRPYSKETSFSSWLRLGLTAADPSRGWETVNCGGISYASYRLVNILKECLAYEPDLFVICTGHNEFLEDRTYEHLKRIPDLAATSQNWASGLRVYRLLRPLLRRGPEPAPIGRFEMAGEVEALLDYRGGLEVYDRNDSWRTNVVQHFGHNLRTMISLAKEAGIPVILVKPPSNLRNSPPFKSLHRDNLSYDDKLEWEQQVKLAHKAYGEDPKIAVRHLSAALKLDDRFASTHYELGKVHELLGQRALARANFVRALDEDICPLRMVPALVSAMERCANETGVPLIDAHVLLEQKSRLRILGNDQLVDHIHPSIDGHKAISAALIDVLASTGVVARTSGWKSRQADLFKSHFDKLDAAYFTAAQRALYGLNEWAAGRAQGPPIESQRSPKKRQ